MGKDARQLSGAIEHSGHHRLGRRLGNSIAGGLKQQSARRSGSIEKLQTRDSLTAWRAPAGRHFCLGTGFPSISTQLDAIMCARPANREFHSASELARQCRPPLLFSVFVAQGSEETELTLTQVLCNKRNMNE